MPGAYGNPVHFSSIENYISDTYLDRMQLETAEKKNKKVAVIGAGPAGMTVSTDGEAGNSWRMSGKRSFRYRLSGKPFRI